MGQFLGKLITLISLLLIGLVSFRVSPVEVEGLYQVEVAVADQTAKTRWGAVLAGFKEVLIRKSGSRQVLSSEEVRQANRKVTAYLQRFQYTSNPLAIKGSDEELPFLLKLDFEPRLIDELIQEAGMPIWGSDRPVTILWIAVEENFNRRIIREDEENIVFTDLLKTNSKRRGIPTILPLMDLEDELNVSISDVWGRFNDSIVAASSRYGADSVVAGKLVQFGEKWQAKLSYISQGSEQLFDFEVDSPELFMETLTDRVAELLCQKYCVVEALTSTQIKIQVSGINNFASFKKVQDYLQGLSSIRKIEVDKIAATSVRFGATLLGDLQSVKDGIELGRKLILETEPQVDLFAKPINLNEEGSLLSDLDLATNEQTEGSDTQSSNLTAELESNNLGTTEPDLSGAENIDTNLANMPEVILYYRWVE